MSKPVLRVVIYGGLHDPAVDAQACLLSSWDAIAEADPHSPSFRPMEQLRASREPRIQVSDCW